MRTHLIHRAVCGDGEIIAEPRQVTAQPNDKTWPKDITIRVPYCVKCYTIVSITECADERIIAEGLV